MKVAVVGSGVTGLGASWLLNEHSPHEVHLFESAGRLGGHTNTVSYPSAQGKRIDVDTGFIVLNPKTYPNFLRFLRLQKIEVIDSEMSFSVSRDRGAYEWAGTSLSAFFAQVSNVFSLSQWQLAWDILRFNNTAVDYLSTKADSSESIHSYLDRHNYSESFRSNYLLPMTAAVWSTPASEAALNFPARTLIQFMNNHHLLQITGRPTWLTVKNGARTYIDRIVKAFPSERIHLSSPVSGLSRRDGRVYLTVNGEELQFDHVILACHADTSLAILAAEGTAQEKAILSQFEFGKSVAVLHSDVRLMPRRRKCWSAWNYLVEQSNADQVSLTYWMNTLQSISEDEHGPVLVTLNPPFPPADDKTFATYAYDHPFMSARSVTAQLRLPEIQNKRGISFAGAWTKYGFHEDGFTSGLRCAIALPDVSCPFPIEAAEHPVVRRHTGLKLLMGALQCIFVMIGVLRASAFGNKTKRE